MKWDKPGPIVIDPDNGYMPSAKPPPLEPEDYTRIPEGLMFGPVCRWSHHLTKKLLLKMKRSIGNYFLEKAEEYKPTEEKIKKDHLVRLNYYPKSRVRYYGSKLSFNNLIRFSQI